MSTTTKRLAVTGIDYDDIRTNLKDFLRGNPNFADYDFEGSAISTIVDLLAYVTHINAVNANLGLNESFIDTAQYRGSVVGHARTLGYTPRSTAAARATVNVGLTTVPDGETVIPRGFPFRTNVEGSSYDFITLDEHRSTTGVFNNVIIAQGRQKNATYIYDVESTEKYVIPERNVDISTLRVEVSPSQTTVNSNEVFTVARSLTEIQPDSAVYFLSENPDGRFEIAFGDGVLGRTLETGNVIRMNYVVTDGPAANGARVFAAQQSIAGSSAAVVTVSAAAGGRERESIDSIRRNAPITFASQNRGVTPPDYEAVVRDNFSNVRSVKAWGGESNDPPVYGKVFVSVQPLTTEVLSVDEKQFIQRNVLLPKSVASITPELIDPELLYIVCEVFFKYDPTRTNSTRLQLETAVRNTIETFNETQLKQFNTVFRYSQFLNEIDDTSDAILNSFVRVYLQKRFSPVINILQQYVIDFSAPLYTDSGSDPVIQSNTPFSTRGFDNCYFRDYTTSIAGRRRIDILTGVDEAVQTVASDVGYIEGSKIYLTNFIPTTFSGDAISIRVSPDRYDIAGTKNNIVALNTDDPAFTITGSVDTIVAGTEFSGINYEGFSRNA